GLNDAVVQFLGDALPLFHQTQPLQLGLRPAILDCHRGLVGKSLHELNSPLVESRAALQLGNHQGSRGTAGYAQGEEYRSPMRAKTHDRLECARISAYII